MTSGAERKRRHAVGQRNITHYCVCGRVISGNVGWWSHLNANSGCYAITQTLWLTRFGEGQ